LLGLSPLSSFFSYLKYKDSLYIESDFSFEMPPRKSLLADESSDEANLSEVTEQLSEVQISPKAKRVLSDSHKAALAAGKAKARERRLLEKAYGKSAMDHKLQVLADADLLKHEKLAEFEKVYSELTNDKIVKTALKSKRTPKTKINILPPVVVEPVEPEPRAATVTAPIPIPQVVPEPVQPIRPKTPKTPSNYQKTTSITTPYIFVGR
jgi:hypothetical protein